MTRRHNNYHKVSRWNKFIQKDFFCKKSFNLLTWNCFRFMSWTLFRLLVNSFVPCGQFIISIFWVKRWWLLKSSGKNLFKFISTKLNFQKVCMNKPFWLMYVISLFWSSGHFWEKKKCRKQKLLLEDSISLYYASKNLNWSYQSKCINSCSKKSIISSVSSLMLF